MKICVYAIAKNEEQFVDRFCDAASEADYIAVLDTGSEDKTVEKLADRGAIVSQKIFEPFRFDEARNESMKLIPKDTDVCVCVDLDEVLLPGWRKILEEKWEPGMTSAKYTCVCSYNADGSYGTAFLREKIHTPHNFRWKYPVHEVLEHTGQWRQLTRVIPEIIAEHHPDETKSRGGYLPLLELAAKEYPNDARCAHYLGREYMYHGMYEEAIEELKRHLSLPSATWKAERSASLRYIAECINAGRGDTEDARQWAMCAVLEAPHIRENWYEAEKMSYKLEDWPAVVAYGQSAVDITEQSRECINEAEAWGPEPYDLLALGYWHIGRADKAVEYGEIAAEIAPDDERIQKNLWFYRQGIEKLKKT